ncbi:MAG: phosphatidate cytidylyltransferase [Aquificaceae bacterium]|nr:phosphatidate cytidylyltransferase [Aquificaceae bacterium]MCX8059711.1 phosphatidate cytidylyltransferase [Aquificaceae bacterium]MDW8097284.1 phosphatidate cytidylyltransferase [Aquificaceae bacterium]
MRFFRGRVGVGLLVGLASALLSLSPYPVLYGALLLMSLLMGVELSRAVGASFYFGAPLAFVAGSVSVELGLVFATLLAFYVGWKSWSLESSLKGLLVFLYAGLFPSFLLELKEVEPYALLELLLFVWAVDVFSYYGGKHFGKRPMAPRLSPHKTWEGLLSGALAGALSLFLLQGMQGLVWALLLLPCAVLGDLFKSFVKRQVGIKDFSNLLGEHGGLIDRFDSLLMTAPVYLFLLG